MVRGLYINSLIYQIEFNDIEINQEYRKYLEKRAEEEGLERLYEEAKKIDEEAMNTISQNDKKRILRVLEIYHEAHKTKTELERLSRQKEAEFNYIVFGCSLERKKLYEKINRRVDIMIENGLIDEVKSILKKYDEYPTAMQALGYKETKEYLDGILTKEEMIEKIKLQTRRYAKRQLTWFRKNKEIIWLDMEKPTSENIKRILEEIKD